MKLVLRIIIFVIINYLFFGNNYYDKGVQYMTAEYDSAVFYFSKVLVSSSYDDSIKVLAFINRGKSYTLLYRYDLALTDFNSALKLARKLNDTNTIAYSYIALAEFYRHISKFNKAIETINKAGEIIKKHKVSHRTKAIYYNRKAAIIAEKSPEEIYEIISNSNIAIEISKKHGFKSIEASSYNQLGFLYYNNNDKRAIIYYKKALAIFEETGEIKDQINVIINMSRYYVREKQYNAGLKIVNKAISLVKKKKWYDDLKYLYLVKMDYLTHLGRYKEAYLTSKQQNETNIKAMEIKHNKNLHELEKKYEVNKKDEQIKLEKERAKRLQLEKKQKEIAAITFIVISLLLLIILAISLFSYFKIKKTNKLLINAIHQKEILLQEVHHRVKNNLTVLKSLLYIQADETTNPNTKKVLNECQARIQSMALVHQNLYNMEDTSKVNLTRFLEQLLYETQTIFGNEKKIKYYIDTSDIEFDMSLTIFLGLIINELLTNSFKYAFDNNKENWISIKLKQEGNIFKLIYSDSGKGLLKDFNIIKSRGFGFKLIDIILTQIKGKLEYFYETNNFVIQFKKS